MSGFREFIAANPAVRFNRCGVCALPEREEIDAEYRSGNHSVIGMYRYLVEGCGRTVTRTMLDNHFTRGHWIEPAKPKKVSK